MSWFESICFQFPYIQDPTWCYWKTPRAFASIFPYQWVAQSQQRHSGRSSHWDPEHHLQIWPWKWARASESKQVWPLLIKPGTCSVHPISGCAPSGHLLLLEAWFSCRGRQALPEQLPGRGFCGPSSSYFLPGAGVYFNAMPLATVLGWHGSAWLAALFFGSFWG